MKRFTGMALTAAALLLGIGLAVYARFDSIAARKTTVWPSTEGHIIASEQTGTSGNPGARITDTYTVDGQEYQANQLSASPFADMFRANAVRRKYAKGSTPTVYYDPTNPTNAVIETGTPTATFGVFLAGLIVAALSITAFTQRQTLADLVEQIRKEIQ